jgi:DNA repair exonuclease SbcCD ATPase subunit
MPAAAPLPEAIDVKASSSAVEAVENLLPHLAERSLPVPSVHGRPLPTVRTAAQRALFRLLRPYWFQRAQFDSHLISALRQICIELASLRHTQQTAIVQVSRDVLANSANAEQQWQGAAAHIESLRSALNGLRRAVSQLSNDRRELLSLQGDVAEVQRMASSLEAHLDDIDLRNQSVAARQDHFEKNATARLVEIADLFRTLESAVSALTDRLSDASYVTEARGDRR